MNPKTDESPVELITQEEIDEGVQLLHGEAVVQFEKPSDQIVETEDGYEVVESLGWIKFSTAFRNRMLKTLKGAKLSIFISICLHLNEHGESFPGLAKIAEETGYHRDTVIVEIQEMELIPGLMKVLRARGKVNHYRPAFAARGKGNEPVGKILPVGSPVGKTSTGLGKTSRGKSDSKKKRGKKILNDDERALQERTAIFTKLYESNIGVITPLLADIIRNTTIDFPLSDWYEPAFTIAVSNNKRHVNYVIAVLQGWKDHYFGWKPEFKNGNGQKEGKHEKRNGIRSGSSEQDEQWTKDAELGREILAERAAAGLS
jgi:DnaD/phage-associated family protein